MDINTIKHNLANNKVLKRFVPKKSLRDVHNYWGGQDIGNKNFYTDYLKNGAASQDFLAVAEKHISSKSISVLEIGCNVGRNLNTLLNAGYSNLSGIEINSNAVQAMKTHYPNLASSAKIYNTLVENKIKSFKDAEFDLVFTFAVLMHIHPQSQWIFTEMARITKDLLITIEDEVGEATKNFPRNYKQIFEEVGMKQIEFIDSLPHLRPIYKTRIFRKLV